MYIARSNKTIEKSDIALSVPSGYKVGSVTSDDKYIYVNYTKNAQTVAQIDIYTWDGTLVKSINVAGMKFGESTSYNVQSIFVHNSEMHAVVCSWDSGSKVNHYKVHVDLSVL